jgi:hypothetical protein
LLGTVGDGVKKEFLTASRVKTMTAQWNHEGVTRKGVKSKMHDGLGHDGVKSRSRQSEEYFGGEVTASEFCS